MRIAVAMAGHLRTFRRCPPKYGKVDFYVATWNRTDSGEESWHGRGHPSVVTAEDVDAVQYQYDCYAAVYPEFAGNPLQRQWWLVENVIRRVPDHYDIVVRSRPDLMVEWFEPFVPDEGVIVCAERPARSVCDAFFFGRWATMQVASKICNFEGGPQEEVFAKHLTSEGIKILKSPCMGATILRPNGSRLGLFGKDHRICGGS